MNSPSSPEAQTGLDTSNEVPQFKAGTYWYVKNTDASAPISAQQVASDLASGAPLRENLASLGNEKFPRGATIIIDEVFESQRLATFRVMRKASMGGYEFADKKVLSATFADLQKYVSPEKRGVKPATEVDRLITLLDPDQNNKLPKTTVREGDGIPSEVYGHNKVAIGNNLGLLHSVAEALRARLTELGIIPKSV